MFSSNENIETIAQLVEELKKYASVKGEYIKLDVAEKTVRVLTAVLMLIALSVAFLLALTYFSFAAAYALADCVGMVGGFSIVGGIYVVLFILCILLRKPLIERPLVRFIVSLLFEKES